MAKYKHTGSFHTFKKVPEKKDGGGVWGWVLGFIILLGIISAVGG